MVYCNGSLLAQGSQFEGLDEVEVVTATVTLPNRRAPTTTLHTYPSHLP